VSWDTEQEDRESVVERQAALDFAESRGWWQAKFVSPSKRGVPDRIFIRKGRVVFIEFKRRGKEATTQQKKRHREMRAHGAEVYVVDNLAEAKRILA
jgi:hypothetical protein